jgi:hypothetical protein
MAKHFFIRTDRGKNAVLDCDSRSCGICAVKCREFTVVENDICGHEIVPSVAYAELIAGIAQ